MSPIVPLRIDAVVNGKEDAFAEALAAREQRRAGFGDRGMTTTLHETLEERLDLSAHDKSDLRYAARKLRASFPDDPDMQTLASHVESWEMFAAEESQKEMTRQMGTMESFLKERGVPMLEQRTAIRNQDSRDQHPRMSGPLGYPVGVKPVAEEVDREVRGALDSPMSAKLRSLAGQVSEMARLSSNVRQKNRLMARSAELRRMSLRAYQNEMESEVVTSDDPTEPNNVMSKLASDMRAEANGAQPDDVSSFDDWGDRPTADQQLADDVRDQLLDEDLPRVPAPGRRYAGEDQLGDPAAGTDEPRGLRRNRADDDILQHVRKGTAKFGSGQPRGGDRVGGERGRYSAFNGRESLRESGDLTAELLLDQEINYFGSHGSW